MRMKPSPKEQTQSVENMSLVKVKVIYPVGNQGMLSSTGNRNTDSAIIKMLS